MRLIKLTKTREEVATMRRNAYLEKWPPHKQLEAHADAARGDPTKLNLMFEDFEAVKMTLPYPET